MFLRFALFVTYLLSVSVYVKTQDFDCKETGTVVNLSLVCNGINDCLHGSDETYDVCKPETLVDSGSFTCGYGAKISYDNQCNGVVECADKSDESPRLCQKESVFNKIRSGKCNDDQVECLSGECVPVSKMCDNQHDCSDGRDESVELCMIRCDKAHFRCANGDCIDPKLQCDNKFDCIDGTDELWSICEGNTTWKKIANIPKFCVQPTEKGLVFSGDTRYHIRNKTRVVDANYMVKFDCYDNSAKMLGNPWDVCTHRGEWHYNRTECVSKLKPINLNPNTNGILGCPINTYDKDRLLIHECENNNCQKEIEPPFDNKTVKFACIPGYTLVPLDLKDKQLRCFNKTWGKIKFMDPLCVKMCSPKRLYCSDSMFPMCQLYGRTVKCNSTELMPNTTARFDCNVGYYKNEGMSDLIIKCQDNGTWSHSPNMDNFCNLKCGKTGKQIEPLAKNAFPIKPYQSPWSVAIYMKEADGYIMKCSGVRVKANIVLTAAHCVCNNGTKELLKTDLLRVGSSTSNRSKVNATYGWAVEDVRIDPKYNPRELHSDTALLKLQLTKNSQDSETPRVICLPWEYNYTLPNNTVGDVCSWETNKDGHKYAINLAMVSASISKGEDLNMYINVANRHKICKGDSGSGFSHFCYKNNIKTEEICLYGVVSSAKNGVDTFNCTSKIKVTDISPYHTKQFLEPAIKSMTKTCEIY